MISEQAMYSDLDNFLNSHKKILTINCDNQDDVLLSNELTQKYFMNRGLGFQFNDNCYTTSSGKYILSKLKAVTKAKRKNTNLLTSYEKLLQDVLENGHEVKDRTGTGTLSVFGRQVHYDLTKSFPLITSKRVYWKAVVHELLWFLQGNTNTKYLVDNDVHIWDEWAKENGDLGPVYGKQWRSWEKYEFLKVEVSENPHLVVHEIDQIANVIEQIKNNPDSRRLIVSAWNVSDIDKMALPPCHLLFQFKVYGDELHCQLYQRSADMFLGVPFNIASYALLTHLIAEQTGLKATSFVHTIGDAHIYLNHIEQAKEQLSRKPKKLPTIAINKKVESIFNYEFDDIILMNYNPHPAIKAEVAI